MKYYTSRQDFTETHVEKNDRVGMRKLGFLGVNAGKDFSASTNGRVNVQNIYFVNFLTLSFFHTRVNSLKVYM